MNISLQDIMVACPKTGVANGWEDGKANPESHIEALLIDLIKKTENEEMKGFYCGIFSAYVSMILKDTPWDTIRFMLDAASEWDPQEIELYK